MSQDNCTYRKALRTFLNEKQNHGIVSNTIYMKSNMINSTQISDINKPGTSYSEILESSAQKDIFQKNKNTEEINSKKPIRTREKGKSSRKKSRNSNASQESLEYGLDMSEENSDKEALEEEQEDSKSKRRSYFKDLLKKLRHIVMSSLNFEDKVFEVIKLLITEVKNYFIEILKETEWLNSIFNIFSHG